MHLVVTGATGNIGTAVVRRLTARGHTVTGLARRLPDPASDPASDPESDAVPSGVRWRAVDLTDDAAVPAVAEEAADADGVVHLAWGFQPSHDLAHLEELGVGGTRRVLEAVTVAGVPQLVHLSSVGAYSPRRDDAPVAEDWPTGGVRTSPYSRHKVAAERLLDHYEADGHDTVVTRMRPGIVGQRGAASALMRYGLPGLVPPAALRLLPVLPLDRGLAVPMVHADDVAEAVVRSLESRAAGAFNLAAPTAVTTDRIGQALGARPVHVPSSVLRPLVSASWHARLQPVDAGWLDLAFAVPLLDCSRAATELGWAPTVDAPDVLQEVVDGMLDRASTGTPVLRRRTVPGALRDLVTRGPVGQRDRP